MRHDPMHVQKEKTGDALDANPYSDNFAEDTAWANTLTRLHQLTTIVCSQSDLSSIFSEINLAALELTHADRSNIQLLDEESGALRMVAQSQRQGGPFDAAAYPPEGWGNSRAAINLRQRVIVEDITKSPHYAGRPEIDILLGAGVRASQVTPLFSSAGHLYGVLVTHYGKPHVYPQRELQVLDLFARLTADSIERFRSEERLRHQYHQVTGINRIYQQVTHHMTRDQVAAITLETICDVTGSTSGLIAMISENGEIEDIVARQPSREDGETGGETGTKTGSKETASLPRSVTNHLQPGTGHWQSATQSVCPGLLQTVLQEGKAQLVNHPADHPAFEGLPANHMPIRTFMCTPMADFGRVVGLVAVANHEGGYTETDLATLEALGEAFVHLLRRWQAEDALQQSEAHALALVEELRKADRSKNEFLGILSHEIRNPLASITMSLSLLDRVKPASPQAQKARDIIDRQTHQLAHLIDDLLDVTRIARNKVELKKSRLNLGELLLQTAEDAQGQFLAKGVVFTTDIDERPIFLDADPTRLVQVVGNLLHNAAKFTIKGDEVRFAMYPDLKNQEAVIEVEDTGEGISPELLPSLFTPFTQADNSLDRAGGGLGLGLSIAKGLVTLHGGSIEAFSHGPGQGTRFTVRLPFADAPAEAPCAERRCGTDGGQPLRILVIEDSRDLAETFSTLLEILGHEVSIAHDGRTGIEMAAVRKPDVILCDIGLPEMDGYAVARAVRMRPDTSDIFMIAISGYAQTDDVERAVAAGFNRHLAKPVEMDRLREILEGDVVLS